MSFDPRRNLYGLVYICIFLFVIQTIFNCLLVCEC